MVCELTITNAFGLNASNAPHVVQKANMYKSSIWIETEGRKVNAKSLLGVISLGVKKDMKISIRAEGVDEKDALDGIVDIIQNGFAG